MTHYIAHQQALIKNNICIAVLAFIEHDDSLMQETFTKFDYDAIVDLCNIQKEAFLGASWDGENFNLQPFESWSLGEDLNWHAPVEKPVGNYFWNEEITNWVESINGNPAAN